ncbi:MAG: GGDEF domain-containing protein [Kiritimatiellaeota bacterium]|nr:GGDEF domain-containing protein [Kiritimatiellota bacterium]
MQDTAVIFLNGLVLAGAWLLIAALLPIRQLVARLPPGRMRRQWHVLGALILFFIAAYPIYLSSRWNNTPTLSDWVAAEVFFLAASFILQVNILALQTALDVRRLAILEQENIIDPLMGIFNRRYLDRQLALEAAEARRYHQPLAVLLLDLDQFKQINDTYGHLSGDTLLQRYGKLVVDTVRETDMVARYGGDELLVIAPNTALAAAVNLAERLRRAVESARLMPAGAAAPPPAGRITVSIGVACLGPAASSARSLIAGVDAALYRAKRTGRNRVVIGEPALPDAPAHPLPG